MSTDKSVTKSKFRIERFMDKYIYPHIQFYWFMLGLLLLIISIVVTINCWDVFVDKLNGVLGQ